MALIVPIGSSSAPAVGDTIRVYAAGTTDLATGLTHYATGEALANPYTVEEPADAEKAFWGFEPGTNAALDVYWDEGAKYLISDSRLQGNITLTSLGGIAHSLAIAANDFIVASGVGVFVKKTLAEVKTILGLGSAAYTNTTAYDAAGAASSAVSGHTSAVDHAPIAHANRSSLDLVSGTNTGDQDLSGYSLTSHNHSGIYDPAGTAASAVSAHNIAVDHAALVTAKTLVNNFFALPSLGVLIVSGTEPSQGVVDQYNALLNPLGITEEQLVWGQVIGGGVTVYATCDVLTLTEYSAAISAAINVLAGTDSLVLTAYAAEVDLGIIVLANTAELTLTEFAAGIEAAINVLTGTDTLTLTPYSCTVSVSDGVTVNADFVALTLTEYAAGISVGVTVIAGFDALALTEYAATVDVAAAVGFTDPFTGSNDDAPNAANWDTASLDADFTATIQSNKLRLAKGATTGMQEGFLPTTETYSGVRTFKFDGWSVDGSTHNFYSYDSNEAGSQPADAYASVRVTGIKCLASGGNFIAIYAGYDDTAQEQYIYLAKWNGATLTYESTTYDYETTIAQLEIRVLSTTTADLYVNGTKVGATRTVPDLGAAFVFGPLVRATVSSAENYFFDDGVVS